MMKKRIVLWCSPGFGMIDTWLPIIKMLNENKVDVIFIFPEPSSLKLIDRSSELFCIASKYCFKVIQRGYSNRWFVSKNLESTDRVFKFSNLELIINNLSIRFRKGLFSKFFFHIYFSKILKSIALRVSIFRENLLGLKIIDLNSIVDDISAILTDIELVDKKTNYELTTVFKNIKKFSMDHGLQSPSHFLRSPMPKYNSYYENVEYFVNSDKVKKLYLAKGFHDENIHLIGFPRHDTNWVKFLNDNFLNRKEEFNDFVLIISRPSGTLIPKKRKVDAITNIKKVIIDNLGLGVMVKLHPKESDNSHNRQMYFQIFGSENYGKTWIFTNSHPIYLAKKCKFAISFFSGVVLDMIAQGKPTIEYLDLNNLKQYDNPDSFRDRDGSPILEYRKDKLVFGCNSYLDLLKTSEKIINNYDEVVAFFKNRYEEVFVVKDNSSSVILKKLLNYHKS